MLSVATAVLRPGARVRVMSRHLMSVIAKYSPSSGNVGSYALWSFELAIELHLLHHTQRSGIESVSELDKLNGRKLNSPLRSDKGSS